MLGFSVLKGIGKTKEVAVTHISKGVLNVILNLILIPFFGTFSQGFLGAIIATTISFFIAFILTAFYLHKHIGYSIPIKGITLASLSGFLALYLTDLLLVSITLGYKKIALVLLTFSLIYLGMIFIFRQTSKKEIQKILTLLLGKEKIN